MSTTSASDDPERTAPAGTGLLTSDDPPTTPSDPAPRAAAQRTWALPLVAGVLVLSVIATAAMLRSTNADIDADRATIDARSAQLQADRASLAGVHTQLADERHQLSLVVDGLHRTQMQLDGKTTDRDGLAAKAEQTRVELFNLRTSLNSAATRLYVQQKLLGELQSCLRSADQALNALSIGNVDLGAAILESAKGSCQVVNDYLAQAGLTT